MSENSPRCCGRAMRGIGVTRGEGVLLHSCSACGRHAWTADGRELDRDALLVLLKDDAPAAAQAARAERATRQAPADPAPPVDKRTELQELLRGFTVHGTSS